MAEIIQVTDLPASIQANELAQRLVDGANSNASRVAPCLVTVAPAWAALTAYAVGDKSKLADGEFLEVTVAGTSGATAPTVPDEVDGTVVDGTVTWERITPTLDQLAEARLVLIGAVTRWAQAGSGAFQQQSAGPFGVTIDTRQRSAFNLWPSEIERLQDLCEGEETSGAFTVDSICVGTTHADVCSLNFGALYCSCGADIAGFPLWEVCS